MSLLKKVNKDEVRRRVPGDRRAVERITTAGRRTAARIGTRPRSRSAALSFRVRRQATAGLVAAKGAARSLRGETKRRWPRRARIAAAAAAAGAAGGAAAFLRDPERRGALVGHALSPLKRIQSPNDETIAERVRSEVFRPQDAPKGSVNVNVEQGVVYLRGEAADQEQIQRLRNTAAAVPGVKRVESLLHTPGEPAKSGSNGSPSRVEAAS